MNKNREARESKWSEVKLIERWVNYPLFWFVAWNCNDSPDFGTTDLAQWLSLRGYLSIEINLMTHITVGKMPISIIMCSSCWTANSTKSLTSVACYKWCSTSKKSWNSIVGSKISYSFCFFRNYLPSQKNLAVDETRIIKTFKWSIAWFKNWIISCYWRQEWSL